MEKNKENNGPEKNGELGMNTKVEERDVGVMANFGRIPPNSCPRAAWA